jgi:hypothetical protein
MILTDEEIKEAVCGIDMQPHYRLEQTFEEAMLDYRAIEAAIMAKFEVVAMVKEPLFGTTSNEITKHLPPFTHLYILKETS